MSLWRHLERPARIGWRPGSLYKLPTPLGRIPYRVVRADAPEVGRRPVLVVGLHGYGSDERQVATLLTLRFDTPVVYLAPRAPLADGGGFSWFGVAVSARGEIVPGDMRPAMQRVRMFAREAARAWETSGAVLIGYSQGGGIASRLAIGDPSPFTAVAALSGGPLAPEAERVGARVPLFIGLGVRDPAISPEAERRVVATMRASGADVTLSEADAAHVVTAGQRAELSAWLARHVSRTRTA